MLTIKINKDLPIVEELASYLEVVAREVREGNVIGDGWEVGGDLDTLKDEPEEEEENESGGDDL